MDSNTAKLVAVGAGAVAVAATLGYYLGTRRNQTNGVAIDKPTVIPVNDLPGNPRSYSKAESEARCSLAALYRVIDVLGWTDQINNHISLRVPGEEDHFLINPYGLHYTEITASNLVKVDINGKIIDPGTTSLGINLAGYIIHSAIHGARKDIQCVVHVHTPIGTAVSSLKFGLLQSNIYSISLGEISYHDFQGVTTEEKEKKDIADSLGPKNKAMILRNHGLIAAGETLESAYQLLMDMMVACEIQLLALSAGVDNLIQLDLPKLRESEGVSAHKFNHGELEYECMMRELDRKGYNTGYRYRLKHYMNR